uniref:Uncharacterized protein n=1 Tax=Triticum urartu TaxID=4572 RepID=A0A8R7PQ79_TRIUA
HALDAGAEARHERRLAPPLALHGVALERPRDHAPAFAAVEAQDAERGHVAAEPHVAVDHGVAEAPRGVVRLQQLLARPQPRGARGHVPDAAGGDRQPAVVVLLAAGSRDDALAHVDAREVAVSGEEAGDVRPRGARRRARQRGLHGASPLLRRRSCQRPPLLRTRLADLHS